MKKSFPGETLFKLVIRKPGEKGKWNCFKRRYNSNFDDDLKRLCLKCPFL